MFLLNAKIGERIHIAPDVWVEVCEVRNGQVRLGIEAPGQTRIYRESALRKAMDDHAEYGPGDA